MELILSCQSWQDAQKISDELLKGDLVQSIESIEVKDKHWRHGANSHKVERVDLIINALEEKLEAIEKLNNKLLKSDGVI